MRHFFSDLSVKKQLGSGWFTVWPRHFSTYFLVLIFVPSVPMHFISVSNKKSNDFGNGISTYGQTVVLFVPEIT